MLNTTITLRRATTSDWGAIASLLQANGLPLDGAQDHLDNYHLALQASTVVGVAGAEIYSNIALLRSMAVAPALHGHGIGRLLLLRVLQEARNPVDDDSLAIFFAIWLSHQRA